MNTNSDPAIFVIDPQDANKKPGSIPLTNGSGSGYRSPKNIRIRNTSF
jgi:hypothetical protein